MKASSILFQRIILLSLAVLAFGQTCNEPAKVSSEGTVPPQYYFFTGFQTPLTLIPLEYIIEPAECQITFSCLQLKPLPADGAPNMCSHTSATAFSSIASTTGKLTLVAIDPDEFIAFGTNYLVEIKGTVGNMFDSNVFHVDFMRPCDVPLVIKEPDPFNDLLSVYVTGPGIEITLNPPLADQDTQTDCGNQIIEFFNADTDKAIDPEIASYDSGATKFSVLPQTELDKVGTYRVYFIVKLADHGTSVKSSLFTIEVVTRCAAPKSLTAPSLTSTSLSYTITEPELLFTIDQFLIDPPECMITTNLLIFPPLPAISPVSSLTPLELRAFQTDSLAGIGSYTILVRAQAGIDTVLAKSVTYELAILDPCRNPDFFDIKAPKKKTFWYTVTKGTAASPIVYTSDVFEPVSKPGLLNLCGTLEVSASGKTLGEITETTSPIAYDTATGKFSVQSDDLGLIDKNENVFVVAIFSSYQAYPKQVKFTFKFRDPCQDASLISILPSVQTDPYPYYYDGSVLNYSLVLPQVQPAFCEFVYKCGMDFGSPRTDLCSVNVGTVSSSFNLETVALNFSAKDQDRILLPPGDYTFVISAFVGAIESADSTFTVKVVDPCSKSELVTTVWDKQIEPDAYYYRGEIKVFTLAKPVITPIFCEVVYTCDMDPTSPRTDLCLFTTDGLSGSFDPDEMTYTYSAAGIDLTPPGEYKFTITATLKDGGGSVDSSFMLTYVDPCFSPEAKVIPRTLPNPPKYLYSQNFLEYEISPLLTDPPNCEVSYSCSISDGARVDLCDIEVGSVLYSKFENLKLSFKALDDVVTPAGDYTFVIAAQIVGGTAIGTSPFTLTVWNPCHNAQLELHEATLFPNLIYHYLDDAISLPYQPQKLAFFDAPTVEFCGAYTISFQDAVSGNPIDQNMFDDGLKMLGPTAPILTFSALATVDPQYIDKVFQVKYTVSLAEYPDQQVSHTFTVEVKIRDQCDPQLLELGILDVKPEKCADDDNNPADRSDNNNDSSSGGGSGNRDGSSNTGGDGSYNQSGISRPVYLPIWFRRLDNQIVIRGGKNLNYFMGEPVNEYGEQMTVEVDFGDLSNATFYEPLPNQIIVDQARLGLNETGYQHMNINASYKEKYTNQTISFNKTIYLLIIEPEVKTETSPPMNDTNIEDEPLTQLWYIDKVNAWEAAQLEKSDGPVPYVKSYSWDGELRIGWSREMKIYEEPQTLPKEKVAIQIEVYQQYTSDQAQNNRHRQLNQLVEDGEIIDSDGMKFMVAGAIEIQKLVNREDEDEVYVNDGIKWQVVEFSPDELVLQVDLLGQHELTGSEESLTLTFWGTKYFIDSQKRKVPFGTKLSWISFRQAEPNEQFDTMSNVASYIFYILGFLFLIQIVTCGSLQPFWMLINSLQLLAHLSMLRANIPVTANLMLTGLLDFIRLRIGVLPDILTSYLAEREWIETRSAFSTHELFVACGYQASLSINLAPFLALMTAAVLFWLVLCIKDLLCSRLCRNARHEVHGNNLMVRIVYECFFEIVLCLLISKMIKTETDESQRTNVLALSLTILVALSIAFLWHLCFRYGPYVRNSYQPNSLMKSCWAYRPLRPQYLCSIDDDVSSQQERPESASPDLDIEDEVILENNEALSAISEADPQSEDSENRRFSKTTGQFTNAQTNDRTNSRKTSQQNTDGKRSVDSHQSEQQEKDFIDGRVSEEFDSPQRGQEEDVNFASRLIRDEIFSNLPDVKDQDDDLFSIKNKSMKSKAHQTLRESRQSEPLYSEHEVRKSPQDDLIWRIQQELYNCQNSDYEPSYGQSSAQLVAEGGPSIQDTLSGANSSPQQRHQNLSIDLHEVEEAHNPHHEFTPSVDMDLEVVDELEGGENEPQYTDEQLVQEEQQPLPTVTPQETVTHEEPVALVLIDTTEPPCKIELQEESDNEEDTTEEKSSFFCKYKIDGGRYEQILMEAKSRIQLEDKAVTNKRFKTLFNGLKRNHEHNAGVVYPVIFVIRRLAYAFTLVFLYEWPYLATLSLMILTLFVLAYILVERPWEFSLIGQQHVWNEIGLYICIVALSFLSASRPHSTESNLFLCWSIIGIVGALILLNSLVIIKVTATHLRLVIKRICVNRAFLLKRKTRKVSNLKSVDSSSQPNEGFEGKNDDLATNRGLLEHKACPIEIRDELHENIYFDDEMAQKSQDFGDLKIPMPLVTDSSVNIQVIEEEKFHKRLQTPGTNNREEDEKSQAAFETTKSGFTNNVQATYQKDEDIFGGFMTQKKLRLMKTDLRTGARLLDESDAQVSESFIAQQPKIVFNHERFDPLQDNELDMCKMSEESKSKEAEQQQDVALSQESLDPSLQADLYEFMSDIPKEEQISEKKKAKFYKKMLGTANDWNLDELPSDEDEGEGGADASEDIGHATGSNGGQKEKDQ